MSRTFVMCIGEVTIRIQSKYDYIYEYCKDYLVESKESANYDFFVDIHDADIEYERKRSEAEDIREGKPIRFFTNEYLETLAVYRKIAEQMLAYDTILFHGSVIAVDGVGYLFTAKSGTGKSTHTRLWRELFAERAVMINDDKPMLKITEDGVTVFGTPWDGKHRLSTNMAVPLQAICILKRDEKNHIEKVSGKSVYPMLLQQTYRSADPLRMAKTLQLLERLMQHTNLYSLGCNMDLEAAKVAYAGMQK